MGDSYLNAAGTATLWEKVKSLQSPNLHPFFSAELNDRQYFSDQYEMGNNAAIPYIRHLYSDSGFVYIPREFESETIACTVAILAKYLYTEPHSQDPNGFNFVNSDIVHSNGDEFTLLLEVESVFDEPDADIPIVQIDNVGSCLVTEDAEYAGIVDIYRDKAPSYVDVVKTPDKPTRYYIPMFLANAGEYLTLVTAFIEDQAVRMSLYKGHYRGDYKPYIFPKTNLAQTESDSNGWHYILHGDGHFDAWYTKNHTTITINNASGNVYRSALIDLTLPDEIVYLCHAHEVDDPIWHVDINTAHNNYPCWGMLASVSDVTVHYYAMSGGSRSSSPNYLVTAHVIGAWRDRS